VITIAGSTSSGKSRFAIGIACILKDKFGIDSEITNADSLQLYSDLKILTAFPSKKELESATHNLFGILSPFDQSSVAAWLEMASSIINRNKKNGKISIICGGTGFYVDALTRGISNMPKIPEKVRNETAELLNKIGNDRFFEKLSEIDAVSAKALHKNDTQRILRAYEVAIFTGKPLSKWWTGSSGGEYNTLASFILLPDKNLIRARSYDRIISMVKNGAIEEVEDFVKKYSNYKGSLCKAIGYSEILSFLNSRHSSLLKDVNDTVLQIYVRTKQYIKRQYTWFKNQPREAVFLDGVGDDSKTLKKACDYLNSVVQRFQ
jgi:tRNA dimethylallyltransferase